MRGAPNYREGYLILSSAKTRWRILARKTSKANSLRPLLVKVLCGKSERERIDTVYFLDAVKVFVGGADLRDSMIEHDSGMKGIARLEPFVLM